MRIKQLLIQFHNMLIKLILSTPFSAMLGPLQVIDNNLADFSTHDELVTYALNYIRKRLPETTVFTTNINTYNTINI